MKVFLVVLFIFIQGCASKNLSTEVDPKDLIPDPPAGHDIASVATKAKKKSSKNKEIKSESCLENRMALDIGSGSTKVLIAEVNTCLQVIQEVHFKESASIKVKESLGTTNEIPNGILQQLNHVISGWKKTHEGLKIKTFKGVATAVFRNASNGPDIIKKLSEQLDIPIQIIDQNREAQLGFYSAVAQSPYKIKDILVWDIGGGSMQMTSYLGKSEFLFHQGQMASVNFKDTILKIKHPQQKPNTHYTPNPLGLKLSTTAVNDAQKIATTTVEEDFKQAAKVKKVIGIGGVLAKSVYRQIHERQNQGGLESTLPAMKASDDDSLDFFTETELDRTLKRKSQLNDAQIGGDYPETDVTNLALVLGFMKALQIQKVYVVNADLTYGLIL